MSEVTLVCILSSVFYILIAMIFGIMTDENIEHPGLRLIAILLWPIAILGLIGMIFYHTIIIPIKNFIDYVKERKGDSTNVDR